MKWLTTAEHKRLVADQLATMYGKDRNFFYAFLVGYSANYGFPEEYDELWKQVREAFLNGEYDAYHAGLEADGCPPEYDLCSTGWWFDRVPEWTLIWWAGAARLNEVYFTEFPNYKVPLNRWGTLMMACFMNSLEVAMYHVLKEAHTDA
jgi:hypothetical protein